MLNFAIIGVGRIGKRHAINLALRLAKNIRLAAVCDISEDALLWCKKFTPRAVRYSDYRQMLKCEKLDGVIIATPHYSHEEIAIYCITQGVNTLIEKPVAVTAAAAKRIIAAAKACPAVKAGVSFNQRSNRMYRKAKEFLESGALGKIQRVNFIITDWYRSQAYYDQGGWRASWRGEGGGALINQCVHQLDILQWLIGMPRAVIAKTAAVNRNITVENDVSAIFEYDGYNCLFSASTHELKGVNRLEIACDKGRIVIGRLSMKIYRHKSQERVNAETTSGYGFAPSRSRRLSYGFFRLISDVVKGQQLRSVRAFANDITGIGKMLAKADEGLNSIELINAAYLSGWTGQRVDLPVDETAYESALNAKKTEEQNL